MSTFFKKISILMFPIFLVLGFPVFTQVISGEFLTSETIMKRQLGTSPVVYGPAYSDQTIYYKSEMVKKINPQVLALGNSKILTMRGGFFNDGVTFYNAGGVAGDIASFRKFLDITGVTPSFIIMTVEPLHFDSTLVVQTNISDTKYQPISYLTIISSIVSQSWVSVYADYFHKKFIIKDIINKDTSVKTIGLNARINGSGLRNDGSYHYGKQYQSVAARDAKIQKAITFIENKRKVEGEELFSTPALNELDAFLAYCKKRNIVVIGYIPPTPKSIEEEYKKYSKYTYMFQTYQKTLPIFQKYNYSLYNFFSLSTLSATDDETIDEYHTSERVMLRTLIKMSETGQPLAHIISKVRLQQLLDSSTNQNDVLQ